MISSVNDKLCTMRSINEKYIETINNRNHLLLYNCILIIVLYNNLKYYYLL